MLTGANVVGYTKCSKQASAQVRSMARNAMTAGLTVSLQTTPWHMLCTSCIGSAPGPAASVPSDPKLAQKFCGWSAAGCHSESITKCKSSPVIHFIAFMLKFAQFRCTLHLRQQCKTDAAAGRGGVTLSLLSRNLTGQNFCSYMHMEHNFILLREVAVVNLKTYWGRGSRAPWCNAAPSSDNGCKQRTLLAGPSLLAVPP